MDDPVTATVAAVLLSDWVKAGQQTTPKVTGMAAIRAKTAMPLSALYDYDEMQVPVRYDLHPYTAIGEITLVSAPPKVGKSTWAALYAHAKATGGQFMGQQLKPGPVLTVGPDEPLRAQVGRFRSLGTPGNMLTVWVDLEPTVERIAGIVAGVGAELVIVDTLPRIARVRDENDNAGWISFFADNDHFIRDSSAAWVVLHHDRKSGGSDGQGIRGASAIFGCVDIAFSIRRDETHRDRRLIRMEGTRHDDAEEVVVELADDSYKLIGEVRTTRLLEDEDIIHLLAVMDTAAIPARGVEERITAAGHELTRGQVNRLLEKALRAGLVERSGAGGQKDPYRYSKLVRSSAPLRSEQANEVSFGSSGDNTDKVDKV